MADAITFGPTVKGLGPEEIVFAHSIDACEMWDIPDQPARAFRDDLGRVQLWFAYYDARRNVAADLNTASSPGHHDCAVRNLSQRNPDPSKYDDFTWLTAPYTLDGRNVYSLSHEEYRGWFYGCPLPPNGDTTKCWYNGITLETSGDSGGFFTHSTVPSHLVASLPYTWVDGTGPYGIFSPSNIIRKQPDDGHLYVIVRAKEAGKSDISCMMRTQASQQALADPTSWRAWGDGPDLDSTESFEVQFVNPYSYKFTPRRDTPAKHMCKDIGGGAVTGVSESLTYNTYFGKYMLVGAYGDPVPGFFYSLSDDLIHWSPNKLLIGLETQHSWQCGDHDPVRDPSLLDPASSSRNFETTGKQLYVYYEVIHLDNCQFGADRDLLRIPIELQEEPPPSSSSTVSAASPNGSRAAQASCKTLHRKRVALMRRLRRARHKLARSHTSATRQRYRRQIKSLKKRLKRLRRTSCRR
jgi:hypothetical protein